MTLPPLTTREFAYVRISGLGKHEAISELLGLMPSEAWNIGDPSPRTGAPRKFMSWRLNSGLDDTKALEMHIRGLLTCLHTKADKLHRLWIDHDLVLQCVGYFRPSGHGMHFDREQVRQAAQLGLALDLDFYYTDDYGHDD